MGVKNTQIAPPGRNARRISDNARSGSAKCSMASFATTVSKTPSKTGSAAASATKNSIAFPSVAAYARDCSAFDSTISTPTARAPASA